MTRLFDALDTSLRKILLVLVAGIVLTVMLQIVTRFILLVSIPWTDELARYLMIWASFIGLGVAYRRGQLIAVLVVKDMLPPKLFRRVSQLSDALCGIFAVVAIIYGVKLCAMNMGQVSAALRISLGLIYAAIPVGCSLFLLFTVEAIFSTPPAPSGEILL